MPNQSYNMFSSDDIFLCTKMLLQEIGRNQNKALFLHYTTSMGRLFSPFLVLGKNLSYFASNLAFEDDKIDEKHFSRIMEEIEKCPEKVYEIEKKFDDPEVCFPNRCQETIWIN